jgi:hypothetical protein
VNLWLIALLVWLLPALVLAVAIGLSVLKENKRRRLSGDNAPYVVHGKGPKT